MQIVSLSSGKNKKNTNVSSICHLNLLTESSKKTQKTLVFFH